MWQHDTGFRQVLAPHEAMTLLCSRAHPGQLPVTRAHSTRMETTSLPGPCLLVCPIFISLSVPQGRALPVHPLVYALILNHYAAGSWPTLCATRFRILRI